MTDPEGGVDFVVLGPIYETPSKAPYGPPLTPAILPQARAACDLPILAIGVPLGSRVSRTPASPARLLHAGHRAVAGRSMVTTTTARSRRYFAIRDSRSV